MKERLELIMREHGNMSAYEFSKALGFKRPDNLYKILDGSTKNTGIEFIRAVKKKFSQYSYEWLLDGIGERYTDTYGTDMRLTENKDAIISQQEKRIGELESNEIFYKNIIETITGKKFKGVSTSAKLDLRINTNLVNIKNDWDLGAIGSFDINKIGRG